MHLCWRRRAVAVLSCAIMAGCTEFEPGNDTLSDETNNTALLPGPPGEDWSCLDSAPAETVAPVYAGNAPRVLYSVQFVDLSSGQLYRNLEVRACGLTDVTCARPVASGLHVDAEGWVDVPLFQGFTGFLEVTSDETLPYMFYLVDPLEPQSAPEYPLGMVSLASIGPLVQLIGERPVEGTGFVALRIFDCQGVTASGVSLSSDPSSSPFYFAGGLPTRSETATGPDGLGGFSNMAPGSIVVEATTRTGVRIRGPQAFAVRAGWMTAAYVKVAGTRAAPALE